MVRDRERSAIRPLSPSNLSTSKRAVKCFPSKSFASRATSIAARCSVIASPVPSCIGPRFMPRSRTARMPLIASSM
eukprot:scaffold16616_cov105-Phaeocystis_antarctica.AAC.3